MPNNSNLKFEKMESQGISNQTHGDFFNSPGPITTKSQIIRQGKFLPKNKNTLTRWSGAEVGSIYEKTGGRKSHWTVSLNKPPLMSALYKIQKALNRICGQLKESKNCISDYPSSILWTFIVKTFINLNCNKILIWPFKNVFSIQKLHVFLYKKAF